MTRRFFSGSGLLLLLLQPLAAQTNKQEEGPQVRFLAERVPDNLGEVVMQNGENKSMAFKLPTNQLSPPVAAAARSFALKTVDKGQTLCNITLPEAGKSFAVILVLAPPAAYAPIVVRTDDPEFKAGDVFFINRSAQTIFGKLGDAKLTLKAGEAKKSHPTNPVNNTYYDIAFATQEGEKTRMLSTTRWPIDNQLRSYVFFFTTAEGSTSFRAVDEYMTPPPQ